MILERDSEKINASNHDANEFVEDVDSTELMEVKKILDCVANTNAYFKNQQIDEPDLTFAQKRSLAKDILLRKPGLFLGRYGKFLQKEHLSYFNSLCDDYEVAFYLSNLLREANNKKIIRNRRYKALQNLIAEGEYFSKEAMNERNPLLYEQMVNQFTDSNENAENDSEVMQTKSCFSFSDFLLDQIQHHHVQSTLALQTISELNMCNNEEEEKEVLSENSESVEKNQLYKEFVNIMYESFLEGHDTEFDYSSVDNNSSYDDDIYNQDIEDSYFDSEEPRLSSDLQ